jgi:peptidoglycan/xylan/chitin deacetylase (PgdA/CDA1 family)
MPFPTDTHTLLQGPCPNRPLSRRRWLIQAMSLPALGMGVGGGHATNATSGTTAKPADGSSTALILVYHRFADTVQDSMTVRKATFSAHIAELQDRGCHIIPLADLVAHRQGRLATLPPRPVVITADDGHRSVAEVMAPMLQGRNWPVTLFIYPSAISNASYAMSWAQLQTLQASGHYNIQSHTYWHPNLVKERRTRTPDDFQRFAMMQLQKSRTVLASRMGQPVSYLAWPFGMFDEGLMDMAQAAGYQASLALGNRPCTAADPMQALPRYLMVDALSGKQLGRLIESTWPAGSAS